MNGSDGAIEKRRLRNGDGTINSRSPCHARQAELNACLLSVTVRIKLHFLWP